MRQLLLTGTTIGRGRIWAISILALVGVADALYLSVKHSTGESVRCTITSGCDQVLMSPYASIGGIPLAFLGLAAYFIAFSLAVLAAFEYWRAGVLLRIQVGVMFLVTIWLLFAQAFLIGHFCQFCLLSAGVTVLMALILFLPSASNHDRSRSAKADLQNDNA